MHQLAHAGITEHTIVAEQYLGNCVQIKTKCTVCKKFTIRSRLKSRWCQTMLKTEYHAYSKYQ